MSSNLPVASPNPKRHRHLAWIIPLAVILPLVMCGILGVGVLALTSMTSSPVAPLKPDLPITVTYRDSYVGQGRVLLVINHSERHLHGVSVTLRAPNGQSTTRTIPSLAPHEKLELGWMELSPWVVESGETATFSHPDFHPVQYNIP